MSTYWKNGEPNWRRMEAMARRGWGRLAGGMDNPERWNSAGGNFRIGRMLASGDLRLVALYLIEQQPRHGYDLIKVIEEKSAGFYSPSPGVVYPALTYLEEAGFATAQADGNKKLYAITDAGRAHLADNREAIESTLAFLAKAGEQMQRFRDFARSEWPFDREQGPAHDHEPEYGHGPGNRQGPGQHHGPGHRPAPEADRDMADVVPELNDARRTLKAAIKKARRSGEEQQHRAAEILRRAAAEIEALGEDDVDI